MNLFKNNIFKNVLAIVFSLGLAMSIFVLVKNPNFFQSNILSIADESLLYRFQRDIGYKIESGNFIIYGANSFDRVNVDELVMEIEYNAKNVVMNFTGLKTNFQYSLGDSGESYSKITLKKMDLFEYGQSMLTIPYDGMLEDVLLGSVYVVWKNGDKQYLSVGSLNVKTKH